MREYKFRVFWYKDKITTSVDTIEFLHGGIRVSDGCYRIGWQGKDCELREFTGLHDKNGEEIYEGDIVLATLKFFNINNEKCKVIFHNGSFGIQYGFSTDYFKPFDAWDEVEVIGNIYDNPELLKEESV